MSQPRKVTPPLYCPECHLQYAVEFGDDGSGDDPIWYCPRCGSDGTCGSAAMSLNVYHEEAA